MVWVRERTIPNERPPFVGEVIANILRIEVIIPTYLQIELLLAKIHMTQNGSVALVFSATDLTMQCNYFVLPSQCPLQM
jgi:hypothetical protein